MFTISGCASKSVLTIGFGCRRLSIFCKAGRWCRCYIVPGVHRHIRALRIAALTGAHKHTRRQRRRRRRRSTVFTRRVSFGKASHQGLEIWAKGLRMGSWEERECSNSKEGSRQSCLIVTLGNWLKAMLCDHWICDDVSVWNLRWQLIGALGRFWPEMRLFWKLKWLLLLVTLPQIVRFL